jgi:hypothetical protein
MLTVDDDLENVFRVPDAFPDIEIHQKIARK